MRLAAERDSSLGLGAGGLGGAGDLIFLGGREGSCEDSRGWKDP